MTKHAWLGIVVACGAPTTPQVALVPATPPTPVVAVESVAHATIGALSTSREIENAETVMDGFRRRAEDCYAAALKQRLFAGRFAITLIIGNAGEVNGESAMPLDAAVADVGLQQCLGHALHVISFDPPGRPYDGLDTKLEATLVLRTD